MREHGNAFLLLLYLVEVARAHTYYHWTWASSSRYYSKGTEREREGPPSMAGCDMAPPPFLARGAASRKSRNQTMLWPVGDGGEKAAQGHHISIRQQEEQEGG